MNRKQVRTIRAGRYQVISQIATSSFGTTYEVFDHVLNRHLIVKQIVSDNHDFLKRKVNLLSSLHHSSLPLILDYFIEEDNVFVVMNYVPGRNLRDILTSHGKPFSVPDVINWLIDLLCVVAYLHRNQIVHGDIKPSNIILSTNNQPVLINFGLAMTQSKEYTDPLYTAPEQLRERIDYRSDLYSLSAIAYHLLTDGEPPSAIDRLSKLNSGLPDPLIPIYVLNPDVPQLIDQIIRRGLALNPQDRFSSAEEMMIQLKLSNSKRVGYMGIRKGISIRNINLIIYLQEYIRDIQLLVQILLMSVLVVLFVVIPVSILVRSTLFNELTTLVTSVTYILSFAIMTAYLSHRSDLQRVTELLSLSREVAIKDQDFLIAIGMEIVTELGEGMNREA